MKVFLLYCGFALAAALTGLYIVPALRSTDGCSAFAPCERENFTEASQMAADCPVCQNHRPDYDHWYIDVVWLSLPCSPPFAYPWSQHRRPGILKLMPCRPYLLSLLPYNWCQNLRKNGFIVGNNSLSTYGILNRPPSATSFWKYKARRILTLCTKDTVTSLICTIRTSYHNHSKTSRVGVLEPILT